MKRHFMRIGQWSSVKEDTAFTNVPVASPISRKLSEITKGLQYTYLVLANLVSRNKLDRVLEPSTLTDHQQHVDDYNQAIKTVMILPYVLVLDMVVKLVGKKANHSKTPLQAVDLCCGPGHFTRMLAKNIKSNVIGVDLSEPMLETAQQNAEKEKLTDSVFYLKSDVTSLKTIDSNSKDIVTFMDGAHHMNTLAMVTKVLTEADRIAKPEGIIVLLDPVRPKTSFISHLYETISGKSYVKLGLVHFIKDFHDSLQASFRPEELYTAIPLNTNRKWVQLIPFGFPAFQIVIGLPEGQDSINPSEGLSSEIINSLIPADAIGDWKMLKLSFRLASKNVVSVL